MAIWQDLVCQSGFTSGYQSVLRFVRKLRSAQVPQARVVIVTAPGEEGQVDYGTGPMVRDPQSGKYRRTRLFVMTLGYSRKSVRLLVFRSRSRVWAELHEKAFRRLGGAVRLIVLDNLREGAGPRHLRSRSESSLSCRAGPLRSRRHALPDSRSGPPLCQRPLEAEQTHQGSPCRREWYPDYRCLFHAQLCGLPAQHRNGDGYALGVSSVAHDSQGRACCPHFGASEFLSGNDYA
jgi:hypothetical protein